MMIEPVMTDGDGRRCAAWLPAQQSELFLRQEISHGRRTAECWAELKGRQARVQRWCEICQQRVFAQ